MHLSTKRSEGTLKDKDNDGPEFYHLNRSSTLSLLESLSEKPQYWQLFWCNSITRRIILIISIVIFIVILIVIIISLEPLIKASWL